MSWNGWESGNLHYLVTPPRVNYFLESIHQQCNKVWLNAPSNLRFSGDTVDVPWTFMFLLSGWFWQRWGCLNSTTSTFSNFWVLSQSAPTHTPWNLMQIQTLYRGRWRWGPQRHTGSFIGRYQPKGRHVETSCHPFWNLPRWSEAFHGSSQAWPPTAAITSLHFWALKIHCLMMHVWLVMCLPNNFKQPALLTRLPDDLFLPDTFYKNYLFNITL